MPNSTLSVLPPADLPPPQGRWYRKRVSQKHGLSGDVFSLIPVRGGSGSIEVPRALLPSASRFLGYDISFVPARAGAQAAADGPGEYILHRVAPLSVFCRATVREGGVAKRKRLPITRRRHIPDCHRKERRELRPALVNNADFYALLAHYDADVLLRVPPDAWRAMAALVAEHHPAAPLWAGLTAAAGVAPVAPRHPDLESRQRSDAPAVRVYREMRDLYSATGIVNFSSMRVLGDTPSVADLRAWGVVDKDLTFADIAALEDHLLAEVLPKAVLHQFASAHADYYGFARDRGDPVLCGDEQTVLDARACGLEGVHIWTDALGGNIGDRFTLLRPERMDLRDLITLAGVAESLCLCGDQDARLAFRERLPLHGFSLLCARAAHVELHPWPEGAWQLGVENDIIDGTSEHIEVLALTSWQRLPSVVSAAELKRTIILCGSEAIRASAMAALSTPAAPVSDVPRKNVVFARHASGRIGPVQEVGHHTARISDAVVDSAELRRGDIELLTKFLGTRRESVVVIVDARTPRIALVSALKYAERKFKVLVAPGARASLATLPEDYDYPVSGRMGDA